MRKSRPRVRNAECNVTVELMEAVRKIVRNNKEILILDYTGIKADKMVEIFDRAKQLILSENKPVLVVSIFCNNYVTPNFMRHVEKEVKDVESLIDRNSIIGLSEVQKWIVKGMNLWYKRQLYCFASLDEALEFLVVAEDPSKENSGECLTE